MRNAFQVSMCRDAALDRFACAVRLDRPRIKARVCSGVLGNAVPPPRVTAAALLGEFRFRRRAPWRRTPNYQTNLEVPCFQYTRHRFVENFNRVSRSLTAASAPFAALSRPLSPPNRGNLRVPPPDRAAESIVWPVRRRAVCCRQSA